MATAKKKIIAITACPVGIAHTYVAQDKLEQAAKALGYDIKVETHGSIGLKNILTPADVEQADLVVIAVSAGAADLKLERFEGKPLIKVEISKVIKDAQTIIKEGLAEARPYTHNSGHKKDDKSSKDNTDIFATDKTGFMKHLMAGVGYMVPFVVFGGIMIAISIGLTKAIYGVNADPSKLSPNFLYYMSQVGGIAFQLMIPILAGFIANSIAGRAALAPAMISAFVANATIPVLENGKIAMITLVYPIAGLTTATPAGFLGALIIGPAVGYLVKWIISWNVPKIIAPIMPIFVIPITVTFLISFIFIYAIGGPIGWVMHQFQWGITQLPVGAVAAVGLLLGAMIGFDMGGPVNKVAFLAASGLVANSPSDQTQWLFMGAVAAAIPVAPIGMGLTTIIFRKNFTDAERSLGITALVMGCIGISEGAIPFAVRDPKRAIISNIVGSAVAGCIAGAFLITDAAAHGGPIVAILGAISSTASYGAAGGIGFFFLAIVAGSLVTAGLYGLLLNGSEWKWTQPIIRKFKKSNQINNENKDITKIEEPKTSAKVQKINFNFPRNHQYFFKTI